MGPNLTNPPPFASSKLGRRSPPHIRSERLEPLRMDSSANEHPSGTKEGRESVH